MRHKQNLIGKSFGKLVVIAEAPKRKNDPAPYWRCKCECTAETEVRAYALISGITKSCGGIHHRTGCNHYKWTGHGEISGRYVCDLKKHAAQRNLPFEITKEQLWDQFLKQGRKCALTGRPLTFLGGSEKYDATASLDRIDSTKGYVDGNFQWVHKDINWFKRDYPQQEFLKMCREVAEYTT
jgi:hypothetical protein